MKFCNECVAYEFNVYSERTSLEKRADDINDIIM